MIKGKMQDFFDAVLIKEGEKSDENNDLEKYKRRIRQEKRTRRIAIIMIIIVVLVVFFAAKYLIDNRTYDNYQVLETSEQVDSSILHYKELGGYVLKYSGDGVSLLDSSGEAIWNDSIQMTAPLLVTSGEVAAIYETKGTVIDIYGKEGKLGEIKTEYPVLKMTISDNGGVAVLLENDVNTLMHYYSCDGSLIASSSGNMKNPGYPVDLALSADGMMLAISYFVADGDAVSSYLAFYNFGDAGKKKEDNLIDGFRFEGVLVPEIQYLGDDTLLACREDGFTIYRGSNIIEETERVNFEKEIISSFCGEDIFGFVFSGSDSEHMFEMQVYNSFGKLQMESAFDIVYDKIKVSGEQIILYNASRLAIIDSNGTVRFDGNFEEGNILDVVKRGMNRYAVACDKGVVTIILK